MSIMGGIGMLSAGLLGSTGLGFAKDHYAGEALQEKNTAIYEVVKAEAPSSFLFLKATGLDGTKLSEAQGRVAEGSPNPGDQEIADASITGDRKTLKADSFIPLSMAVIYRGILLYFNSIGGYKPVSIETGESKEE